MSAIVQTKVVSGSCEYRAPSSLIKCADLKNHSHSNYSEIVKRCVSPDGFFWLVFLAGISIVAKQFM